MFAVDSICFEAGCLGDVACKEPSDEGLMHKSQSPKQYTLGVDGIGFHLHIAKNGGTAVASHFQQIFAKTKYRFVYQRGLDAPPASQLQHWPKPGTDIFSIERDASFQPQLNKMVVVFLRHPEEQLVSHFL